MARFNPSRLELARKRRGFKKTELSTLVQLTPRRLADFESGRAEPPEETLARIARALDFPVAFFMGEPLPTVPVDGVSFRSLASLTSGQRDVALASCAFAIELMRIAQSKFKLPRIELPELDCLEPEVAAAQVRAEWQLGEKRIPDMIALLESRGIRVFSLAQQSRELDALSFWHEGTPYVFLNTIKSAERSRFDAAHELGHLLLHRKGHRNEGLQGPGSEREADLFASCFLMPGHTVRQRVRYNVSLDELVSLKTNWGVSVSALVRRAYDVGAITEWQYRHLNIEISMKGYRKEEPSPIPREVSSLMRVLLPSLRDVGLGRHELAAQLGIPLSDFDELLFNLAMVPVQGTGGFGATPGGKLRLL